MSEPAEGVPIMSIPAHCEVLEDRVLLATFAVINTNNSGAGSLRQSMLDANATVGLDTITFNIPGSGVHSIGLTSPLPTIVNPLTIDGTTQPGVTNGVPLIELNGVSAGTSADGIAVTDAEATIRGLIINRFNGRGVAASAPANTIVIESNYIGTDATGLLARANTGAGIQLTASNSTIGGAQSSQRNVISANGSKGIIITGSNNLVINNFIGVGANFTTPLGNKDIAVLVTGASTLNTITGNIIANSAFSGVAVASAATGTEILNNAIYNNATLGIDLEGDGLTPNDGNDSDTGANNRQNFPVISTVDIQSSGTKLHLAGTLKSTPSRAFDLEFFSTRPLEPADVGEGPTIIGQTTVTTNASGNATFNVTFSGTISSFASFTATATDNVTHDTSEFSIPVGGIYLAGTNGNDNISFTAGENTIVVSINGAAQTFAAATTHFLGLDARDGDDSVTIGQGLPGIYVLGGLGRDTLSGGAGRDTLTGGGDNDTISGGTGDDRLAGSGGRDLINGNLGNDRIYGAESNDTLIGAAGVDRIFGGSGNDQLVGNGSNDKLYGEDDNDSLYGSDGNDILHGDDGFDELLGQDDNDTIDGGSNADTMFGGAGDDLMAGGGGDDAFSGDIGKDTMLGNIGNDAFAAKDNEKDSVNGGSGEDSATADASLDILLSIENS
jgi:Ca2+-binding RTX toxin-like protein